MPVIACGGAGNVEHRLLWGPAVPYLAVVVATALAARLGADAVASALMAP